MKYLLVSDVFGRTQALEEIADQLNAAVDIFDPYASVDRHFDNEGEAYSCFMSEVGLDQYTQNLQTIIASYSEPILLIGFSVGASAIWKLSENENLKHISTAVCFYGSQIRNHKTIKPQFPIRLVFPVVEKTFSVPDLISDLTHKDQVEIIEAPYLHGFMNSHSENFNQSALNEYIHYLNHN